jgi:hypothetical protein
MLGLRGSILAMGAAAMRDEIASELRREALEEVGRIACLAEDYAQKLFDATDQRDLMALAVRLQQLRLCTINMIQTFNHFLREKPDGQGVAAKDGSSHADCADQRSSDGVA